jgi:hypothetical protein
MISQANLDAYCVPLGEPGTSDMLGVTMVVEGRRAGAQALRYNSWKDGNEATTRRGVCTLTALMQYGCSFKFTVRAA